MQRIWSSWAALQIYSFINSNRVISWSLRSRYRNSIVKLCKATRWKLEKIRSLRLETRTNRSTKKRLVICKMDCHVNQPLRETSAEKINTASKEMNSSRVERERAIPHGSQRLLFRHDCKINLTNKVSMLCLCMSIPLYVSASVLYTISVCQSLWPLSLSFCL